MKTYKTYDEIPSDVFQETIEQIAFEDFAATIGLPGIYEVISEAYNNEALERLCPDVKE